ncbi:hypothetical protein K474DRAFT_1365122 [Panus rudis PR-1116 ss-1]|nr:hypothetical protein K474DRAFT_1365122 [Panus rudis PR-1116 ss-1]
MSSPELGRAVLTQKATRVFQDSAILISWRNLLLLAFDVPLKPPKPTVMVDQLEPSCRTNRTAEILSKFPADRICPSSLPIWNCPDCWFFFRLVSNRNVTHARKRQYPMICLQQLPAANLHHIARCRRELSFRARVLQVRAEHFVSEHSSLHVPPNVKLQLGKANHLPLHADPDARHLGYRWKRKEFWCLIYNTVLFLVGVLPYRGGDSVQMLQTLIWHECNRRVCGNLST